VRPRCKRKKQLELSTPNLVRIYSIAGILRRRHRHRHPREDPRRHVRHARLPEVIPMASSTTRDDPREDVGEDVGVRVRVGAVVCQPRQDLVIHSDLEIKRSKVKVTRLSNALPAWVCRSIWLLRFLVNAVCQLSNKQTRSIWKMLGPFATASRCTLPFTRCRYCRTPPLSHAACASISTTTTTTRDRGDRYGPRGMGPMIDWQQGRRSLWERGTCPPNIYKGLNVHVNVPPIF